VFCQVKGAPYHPSYLTHRWADLCRAAGVPVIALHDARHTAATLAASAGVDLRTLQARLGHADAKILTRVYLHLVTEAGRGAATTVERVVGPHNLALRPPAA
jgi:integrase